jgi:coenzyme PQQ synthesis protein D (PqqD)
VPAPTDTDRVLPAPDVLSRTLDGEAVLLDLASGRYFGLNEVGTRVWELLGAGKSVAEIREALLGEFDVPADVLERDVSELLDALRARGLVRPAPGDP